MDSLFHTFDAHVCLSVISMPIPTWLHSIQQGYVNESSLSEIIQQLASKPSVVPSSSWDEFSLRYTSCMVLPQSTDLKHAVFYELHASPSAGHSGFIKTYEQARNNLFWKGSMRNSTYGCRMCSLSAPQG